MLLGCEVGGFRQGFRNALINVADTLTNPFGNAVGFSEFHNYLSLWNFGGSAQPALVSLHGNPEGVSLVSGREIYAVLSRFDL